MKKANSFLKDNIITLYIGVLIVFFTMMLTSCEKEPIEPFSPPIAIDSAEIEGEWNISEFYFLEEGYRIDLSAWVVYVDDSISDIGKLTFNNGAAQFDLIYGTRAEGYESQMRWGDNHNSSLQDTSILGWNWRAEKPLCNVTDYTYEYNPAQYFLGLTNGEQEPWTTTYKTSDRWVVENTRYYNDELELTGDHFQYRQLILER
jgi:hypothetical protein